MKILINPIFLLGICFLILIIVKLIFKLDYMGNLEIIRYHINNFRSKNNNKLLKIPFFIYFILPLILAVAVSRIKVPDKDIVENITVVLSILTSMLFTILTLLIDFKGKLEERTNSNGPKVIRLKNLIREIYYTIMFEIIVSVLLLLLTFIFMMTNQASYIISVIIYYLLFLFIFNLLIVLNRIFKIYEEILK
ncbi:hypothetical protein [Clostridium botulinum]|uniref:hypothetical protein n=1 Tax=Clostridium botulinum TaxID=1491 RepID=UPI0006AC7D5B|nr:hypothetical protein [Clostridium botulinum]KOR54844.1 hypothetical protein ADT23_00175 [Clostridium botulinum]MBY6839568.1 hypothetical protein [Clostridium botulinum]NFM78161.1 hypothetical protein [Clostridium botulinum]NFN89976.1 hypothetical protein [Clostridium botulinum]